MIDIRVVETLQHIRCELLQFLHRQVEGLHQLLELYFVDVFADNGVVASVAHDVDTAQVSHRRQDSVRAVEQRYFALVVRLLALGNQYMQTGFLCGELLTQLLDRHVLRFLDYPEVENLGLYNQVVCIAHFLLNSGDVLAGEARYDTIHQRCADIVVFREPLLKALVISAEVFFPEFDVLIDALLEVVSVEEDQLARHDDKTLARAAVESLVAAVEQLNQLAGVRTCGSVGELARGVEGDTCLGGVRDDEADFWLVSECHESGVLRIGVQRTRDDIDTLQRVHCLTVQTTLQVDMVQAVLPVEPFYHTFVNRLNDNDRCIEIGLCVHVPNNPIHECAEEVPLAELNDFLRCYTLRRRQFV